MELVLHRYWLMPWVSVTCLSSEGQLITVLLQQHGEERCYPSLSTLALMDQSELTLGLGPDMFVP